MTWQGDDFRWGGAAIANFGGNLVFQGDTVFQDTPNVRTAYTEGCLLWHNVLEDNPNFPLLKRIRRTILPLVPQRRCVLHSARLPACFCCAEGWRCIALLNPLTILPSPFFFG